VIVRDRFDLINTPCVGLKYLIVRNTMTRDSTIFQFLKKCKSLRTFGGIRLDLVNDNELSVVRNLSHCLERVLIYVKCVHCLHSKKVINWKKLKTLSIKQYGGCEEIHDIVERFPLDSLVRVELNHCFPDIDLEGLLKLKKICLIDCVIDRKKILRVLELDNLCEIEFRRCEINQGLMDEVVKLSNKRNIKIGGYYFVLSDRVYI